MLFPARRLSQGTKIRPRVAHARGSHPRFPSTLVLWLAEQEWRDVGDLWRLSVPKRHRPADGHGGKPDARGQEAVQHAFAETGRQSCGDPMADELLDEAVADRHAAGDRYMCGNRAQ